MFYCRKEELRKLITKTIKNCLHESELLKFTKSETVPSEDEMYKYPQNEISNAVGEVKPEEEVKEDEQPKVFRVK